MPSPSKVLATILDIHPELAGEVELAGSKIGNVMYKSQSAEWETPQSLFDKINLEFHFNLDPAANDQNHKCERYFTKREDGLKQPWTGIVFVNPPYGAEIGKWVQKGYFESKHGALVVMLVPARTDTKWWHEYVMRGEIRFIRGRVQFINPLATTKKKTCSAPFPSAIVIFRDKAKKTVTSYQLRSDLDMKFKQAMLM